METIYFSFPPRTSEDGRQARWSCASPWAHDAGQRIRCRRRPRSLPRSIASSPSTPMDRSPSTPAKWMSARDSPPRSARLAAEELGIPVERFTRDRRRHRPHARSRRNRRQFRHSARRGRYPPGGGDRAAGAARSGREATQPAGVGTDDRRRRSAFTPSGSERDDRVAGRWQAVSAQGRPEGSAARIPPTYTVVGKPILRADVPGKCTGQASLPAGLHAAGHAARPRGSSAGDRREAALGGRIFRSRHSRCSRGPDREFSGRGGEGRMGGRPRRARNQGHVERLARSARQRRT